MRKEDDKILQKESILFYQVGLSFLVLLSQFPIHSSVPFHDMTCRRKALLKASGSRHAAGKVQILKVNDSNLPPHLGITSNIDEGFSAQQALSVSTALPP